MNTTSLVLSNSRLHININEYGFVKDAYFPNVGEENHLALYSNPIRCFINKELITLDKRYFDISIKYIGDSMNGEIVYKHKAGKFQIKINDIVSLKEEIHYRNVLVENLSEDIIDIKLLFDHNFSLLESSYADTVIWYQPMGVMWQYKKNRHVMFGAQKELYQFSCAAKTDNNGKGVMPDNNGELDLNPVSTGDVCSTISLQANLGAKRTKKWVLFYCYSKTLSKVQTLCKRAKKTNVAYLFKKQALETSMYIDEVLNIKEMAVLGEYFNSEDIQKILHYYKRSLLILNTQINHNGGVIAGNDGQYLKLGGTDHYSYLWPRDAAFCAKSLLCVKDIKKLNKVLDHTLSLMSPNGFYYHKYMPSSNERNILLGSSWHSFLTPEGKSILPIQQDASLLVALVLLENMKRMGHKAKLNIYWQYLKRMLRFIFRFNFVSSPFNESLKDKITGARDNKIVWFNELEGSYLPLPSYDIWEQYYGVFTLNAFLIVKVLEKTLDMMSIKEDLKLEQKILEYLPKLKGDIDKYLKDDTGKYIKGIRYDKNSKKIIKDGTADSSLYLLSEFGIDEQMDVTNTINFLDSKLLNMGNIKGVARKENDHYLRASDSSPSNFWFISTFFKIRHALKINDIDMARDLLLSCISHFDDTGLIAEQYDPLSGYGLGIKPLTWSHAEFIITIKAFMKGLHNCST